jgi:adenylate cyclase
MRYDFDYTTAARRLWARSPVFAYLSIQVSFWITANLLLGVIMHVQALRISEVVHMPGLSILKPILQVAVIFGFLYAIVFGLVSYHLEERFYRKKSLGLILILNVLLSLLILVVLLTFVRFVLVSLLMPAYVEAYPLSDRSWGYFLTIVVVYFFFMTLLINFINQVNRKFGPGVLLPLLLGKYRQPREEERIFMFMDLKGSTTHAERLGHLRYSAFIRDSFMDINNVVSSFDADIYQYVGDEIVLSWRIDDGIRQAFCIGFYFACCEEFLKRRSYYIGQYKMLPEFKAGVHGGKVTAVEIGNIKREIAYHGDVLNTSARIQGMCNHYNQQLIISTELLNKISLPAMLTAESLGSVLLKGKEQSMEVSGISMSSSHIVP